MKKNIFKNKIPEKLLDCLLEKKPVNYKGEQFYITQIERINNDLICVLMNIKTFESVYDINSKLLSLN